MHRYVDRIAKLESRRMRARCANRILFGAAAAARHATVERDASEGEPTIVVEGVNSMRELMAHIAAHGRKLQTSRAAA
jgi:hypothetical protein